MQRSVVSFLLVASLAAQDFAPAPQVAKLDRLLGTWEGSGKVHMGPGAPATPWTAQAVYQKVLGGHFVQCDERIEFPEGSGVPGSLVFKTLFGWDREGKTFKSWCVSNMGRVEVACVHWLDDDTMVTGTAGNEQGQPKLERWTTKLAKDTMTIVGHQALGTSDLYVHVEGSMKRGKDKPQPADASAVKAFMPPNENVAKLAKILGTYAVKGEVVMVPGQPAMPISGTETLTLTLGGTIIEGVIHGDPTPGGAGAYEAWGAWGWDAEHGCYAALCADTMGRVCDQQVRWSGKDLVATLAGTDQGSPMVVRTVIECSSTGSIASVTSHTLSGTQAPHVGFKATYTKK